ncbi:leucine-rich repeat-containing protein 63 [Rhinophrynus dorsalis]
MEAPCLTLRSTLEPPKLLRRPLPPKILPALVGNKPRAINYEECILDQQAPTLAASILSSNDFPIYQTKDEESIMPSGPAHFPAKRHHRKLPAKSLPLINDDPRYQPPPPEFTLTGITAQSSLLPRTLTDIPSKPVLSHQPYSNMEHLIAKMLRQEQRKVHSLVLSAGNIPGVSRRVPERQLILAFGEGEGKAPKLAKCIQSSSFTLAVRVRTRTMLGAQMVGRAYNFGDGEETRNQLLESQYLHDSEKIYSGSSPEDHRRMLFKLSDLAVLESLVHGGSTLRLKAYFISRLPDLTPLYSTLLYLNLSFNDLRYFPSEVYKLEHLEVLKLRNNPIEEIPFGIHNLKKLKIFTMSFCLLSSLPPGLFTLHLLQVLDVSYNSISSIPNEMRNLRMLEFLNVEGNNLPALPCGALKLPLKCLRVGNNAMHPLFWRENTHIKPQRLTDLAALSFAKNMLHPSNPLPKEAKMILQNVKVCDCCRGPLYGQGLRFIRPCEKMFGIRKLPFMFNACSQSCYKSFMCQTESLAMHLYDN